MPTDNTDAEQSTKRGYARPRIETPPPPTTDLKQAWSRGWEAIQWIEETLSLHLMPHQRYLILRSCECNPDGTLKWRRVVWLSGRQCGKSTLVSALAAYWMAHRENVIYSSASVDVAREQFLMTAEYIEDSPEIYGKPKVRQANGQYGIELPALRTKYSIAAQNRRAGRGRSAARLLVDEVREMTDDLALDAMLSTTLAVANSQAWLVSNAGDLRSIPLNRAIAQGRSGESLSTLYLEYSAPDGAEVDSPASWRFHPAYGRTISDENVRMLLESSPVASFRTEFLCQSVPSLKGAITPQAWDACEDIATLDAHRSRIALCFDLSDDLRHATLCAASLLPSGVTRIEMVAQWDSTAAVRSELPDLVARINPRTFGWFSTGPASAMATELKAIRKQVELSGNTVTSACQELAELVTSGKIAHSAQDVLTSHVVGAQRQRVADAWRFSRRDGYCDAAFAAAGAVHLARQLKPSGSLSLVTAETTSKADDPDNDTSGGTHGQNR